MNIYHRLHFSRSRHLFFLCHWEQRTDGNPKLVGMLENHSVETKVPQKMRFGGQGATPEPDSEYAECILDEFIIIIISGFGI